MSDSDRHATDAQAAQAGYEQLRTLDARVSELLAIAQRADTPAQLRPITFDASIEPAQLIHRDDHGPAARSFGIVNPTAARIYVGFGGERPIPGGRAFVFPPEAAMVVPVSVDRVEIGIDPADLGANSATIWRLRFEHVQPFYLGSL